MWSTFAPWMATTAVTSFRYPGRSRTTTESRASRPSAHRPRSMILEATFMSMLPPERMHTVTSAGLSRILSPRIAATPPAPPPSTTIFSDSMRKKIARTISSSSTTTTSSTSACRCGKVRSPSRFTEMPSARVSEVSR